MPFSQVNKVFCEIFYTIPLSIIVILQLFAATDSNLTIQAIV